MSENIHEATKAAFFKDWKDAPKEPERASGFQEGWYKGWDAASAEVAALRSALESMANASHQTLDTIKRENFVFDNLNDRWQKLAFTIYSDICQLSTDARHAIEDLDDSTAQEAK